MLTSKLCITGGGDLLSRWKDNPHQLGMLETNMIVNEETDLRQTRDRMQYLSKLYAVNANWNDIKACTVCTVAELW